MIFKNKKGSKGARGSKIVAREERICPLFAFLIPILVFMIAFIAEGVWPFGDRAVTIIDSFHQYVPFFSELHDKVMHGESLLYSWHGGLGFNFLAVMAYYIASPLNILLVIFPAALMREAFEVVIL